MTSRVSPWWTHRKRPFKSYRKGSSVSILIRACRGRREKRLRRSPRRCRRLVTPLCGPGQALQCLFQMPLLCYITDRKQFPGDGREQQLRLLEKIAECAAAGVDYVQLREKDLSIRELQELAHRAVSALPGASKTKLLINSLIDFALGADSHGVH